MATFLDIGIFQHINIVFVFILVFAIVYALLEKGKPFGDNKGLHGIIAIAIAFILIISNISVALVNFFTSWFVVLFLFIVFSLFVLRIFGAGEKETLSLLKDSQFYPYLIVLIVIILIAGLATVFGQNLLEKGTGDAGTSTNNSVTTSSASVDGGSPASNNFGSNVLNTLVHPKVLGFIAIMLIGTLTIALITKVD